MYFDVNISGEYLIFIYIYIYIYNEFQCEY